AEGRGFEPPRDLLGPYPISSRTPSTGLGHPSAPMLSSLSTGSERSSLPRRTHDGKSVRSRLGGMTVAHEEHGSHTGRIMDEKTPNAPSEQQAEGERAAIRKAIDETEAPTRAEVKHPPRKPKKPKAAATDDDRQPGTFPPTSRQSAA